MTQEPRPLLRVLVLLLTKALGLFQWIEIDQRPDKKFRQGCIGAYATAEVSEVGQVLSLYGLRVGVCPEVWLEGQLRHLAHPQLVLCAGGLHSTLFLLPNLCFSSTLFKSGSWVFWSLLIFGVQNLPQLCLHAVIFSLIQFLCILLLEERCVQVQALQQSLPGPRPVSASSEKWGW